VTRLATAVVVCAYTLERWDDLCAALWSATSQQPAPDELWLVVDHNEQLQARAEAELLPRLPRLRVIANARQTGLSGARNSALEQTGAEVVVFLDDDAIAEPGWLNWLTAPYDDPQVIAVGGVAKPRWPTSRPERPVTLPSAGPDHAWAVRGELDWVVGCTYAGQPTALTPVRNLMGCNMSFRRSVFAEIGGFSEHLGRVGKLPLGCEETELCIRAAAVFSRSSIVLEPRARVRHHVSPDRLTWSYLSRRCYSEGVSKAAVAALVGWAGALSTERGYATRVLPAGLGRQLREAAEPGQWRRALGGAVAILLGFGATAAGYLRGSVGARQVQADVPQLALARATDGPARLQSATGLSGSATPSA